MKKLLYKSLFINLNVKHIKMNTKTYFNSLFGSSNNSFIMDNPHGSTVLSH